VPPFFNIFEHKKERTASVIIENKGSFSVKKTFDCGQCFRFEPVEDSWDFVRGVVGHDEITVRDLGGAVEILGSDDADFWKNYLSLDADYDAFDSIILSALTEKADVDVMKNAVEYGKGIRILRQNPWETLVSFIISQNNNIPRIKKIISAMCEKYGEHISDKSYSFPTVEALTEAGEDGIFELRCGFRAKYIYDCAKKVHDGEIVLSDVFNMATYEEADEYLRRISGVGPKVSACALLFGFGRLDAFPVDVWVKRIMAKRFPNGLDYTRFGNVAGLAQQYLFYYERWDGDAGK